MNPLCGSTSSCGLSSSRSIRYETAKVSALSAAAGIPGILALPATVPADVAQYVGHMLRIAQKLACLYSRPELFSDDGEDVDDATKGVLTLFFGVMFGTQSANASTTSPSTTSPSIARCDGSASGSPARCFPSLLAIGRQVAREEVVHTPAESASSSASASCDYREGLPHDKTGG